MGSRSSRSRTFRVGHLASFRRLSSWVSIARAGGATTRSFARQNTHSTSSPAWRWRTGRSEYEQERGVGTRAGRHATVTRPWLVRDSDSTGREHHPPSSRPTLDRAAASAGHPQSLDPDATIQHYRPPNTPGRGPRSAPAGTKKWRRGESNRAHGVPGPAVNVGEGRTSPQIDGPRPDGLWPTEDDDVR
jgi:hypothetical protein